MFTEILYLSGLILVGSAANWGILHLIYGRNLTVKMYLSLQPGIFLLLVIAYLTKMLGGVFEWKITLTLVPLGAALYVLNVVVVGQTMIKSLNGVSEHLLRGSQQVAAASGQVASSAQFLAEGSSQQAASLEETSSSLEEMSSMTRQNAENARQADGLMGEAKQVVGEAGLAMSELKQAMEKIESASGEMAKIIKTIDEIAFQTNLLALNAAVEAARAGEAGAGFAVVADEVRNLAMRAAEAAKGTTSLIESNLGNISNGSALMAQTDRAFGAVAASASKVGGLVAEIAAASGEQAHGIEQLTQAANQMDKVTQQVAAKAEESAAAAEELSAQAENMQGMMGALAAMLNGANKAREVRAARPALVHGDRLAKRLPATGRKRLTASHLQPRLRAEGAFSDF